MRDTMKRIILRFDDLHYEEGHDTKPISGPGVVGIARGEYSSDEIEVYVSPYTITQLIKVAVQHGLLKVEQSVTLVTAHGDGEKFLSSESEK